MSFKPVGFEPTDFADSTLGHACQPRRAMSRRTLSVAVIHPEPAIANTLASWICNHVPHADVKMLLPCEAVTTSALCAAQVAICAPDASAAARFATLGAVHDRHPQLPIIALIPRDQPASVHAAVRAGAANALLDGPDSIYQLPTLVRATVHAGRRNAPCVEHRVELDSLRRQVARLELLATVDELTGLLNRRGLDARLDQVFAARARSLGSSDLACLAIDVDNLKPVNDRFGHAAGDRVLRAAADAIRKHCRRDDAPARTGGDEFVLLLPGAGPARARRIAERLQHAFRTTALAAIPVRDEPDPQSERNPTLKIEVVARKLASGAPREHGSTPATPNSGSVSTSEEFCPPLGLSVGVACLSALPSERVGDRDALGLLEEADRALYRAKSAGKGRVEVYVPAYEVTMGMRAAA